MSREVVIPTVEETLALQAARIRHLESLEPFFGVPSNIGLANAEGTSNILARLDHVHAHPALTIEPFDAHLNNPACRVYRNATQAIPNGAWASISFNIEQFDTDNIWIIGSPTELTCRTAGKYQISACVMWDTGPIGRRLARIVYNGVTMLTEEEGSGAHAGIQLTHSLSTLYHLNVNDYLEVWVLQFTGAPLNIRVDGPNPHFAMARVG